MLSDFRETLYLQTWFASFVNKSFTNRKKAVICLSNNLFKHMRIHLKQRGTKTIELIKERLVLLGGTMKGSGFDGWIQYDDICVWYTIDWLVMEASVVYSPLFETSTSVLRKFRKDMFPDLYTFDSFETEVSTPKFFNFMTHTKPLTLAFWVACDTLPEQLQSQGFKFKEEVHEIFKGKLAEWMIALKVMQIKGIITDGEFDKIATRFVKHVGEHIEAV